MRYFALIAAILSTILAGTFGHELKVNLFTSIPYLIMNAPEVSPTSYNSASERKIYKTNMLSVMGNMVFTETDKPQRYDMTFGIWSGVVSSIVHHSRMRQG